jgi:hypothetical protein
MKLPLMSILLALSACHDKGPPAPTAEQAQQLNDADEMLNALANE